MLRFFLLLLGVVAGAVLPIQASLNARVGQAVGSPVVGALVSFGIGALALLGVVLAQGTPLRQLSQLRALPPLTLVGGLLGAFYVVVVTILAPRLGATLTVGLVVVGQLLLALMLDQYGLLGLPLHPLSVLRGLGVALLLLGFWLIQKY